MVADAAAGDGHNRQGRGRLGPVGVEPLGQAWDIKPSWDSDTGRAEVESFRRVRPRDHHDMPPALDAIEVIWPIAWRDHRRCRLCQHRCASAMSA